jgi:D-alanyl-D-alanine carboxypeptidase/D-alanyl-D-alanine-endopeptidase (penicillin-binding protein 4)
VAHFPSTATKAWAPSAITTTASANARIWQVLRTRTRLSVLGSRFTMTVWDTATSRYIYRRRSQSSLKGASTTKILTAVGALSNLGPEHRFTTTVRAGAPGEVVLVAGGDPMLSSADLRALAQQTAAALGVPRTAPDPAGGTAPAPAAGPAVVVRADDSLFQGSGYSRGWRSSYTPHQVRPVGAFARDNRATYDATGDAGSYFAAALREQGVQATYGGEAMADPAATTLAELPGHSVADAVAKMLLDSDNDYAEMLFRHIAISRGQAATWAGARRALGDTLVELRIPQRGVRIIDGSGLSLQGRVTAYSLTSALNRALSPEHPRLAGLRQWLPVAGRTGTLSPSYRRFDTSPASCAAGLIQAKTGTVSDAISLAGFATGADGSTKIFVSIVNSRPTRYSRSTTRRYVDRAAASVTGCW